MGLVGRSSEDGPDGLEELDLVLGFLVGEVDDDGGDAVVVEDVLFGGFGFEGFGGLGGGGEEGVVEDGGGGVEEEDGKEDGQGGFGGHL